MLCLVTDRRRLAPVARTRQDELLALDRQIAEAIAAGVDLIQIRERDLPARVLLDVAARAVTAARGSKTRLVVNDRMDVALAAAAHGVHVRSDGPPVPVVRTIAPEGWIVGRSIHGASEAAAHADADYVLLGAIFPSQSKEPGAPGVGLDELRAAAAAAPRTSIVAIGGVTPENAAACIDAGASGVAAIGAFMHAETSGRSMADLVRKFREAVG